jgi:hypothetical protein
MIVTNGRVMKEISQDTQNILTTLKKVATETLERKQRLGEYAVVWYQGKPVILEPKSK